MSLKEELLREIETAPQPVIEEVFDFLQRVTLYPTYFSRWI